MAPRTTATSISTFLMSHGTLLVLEPLRQITITIITNNNNYNNAIFSLNFSSADKGPFIASKGKICTRGALF